MVKYIHKKEKAWKTITAHAKGEMFFNFFSSIMETELKQKQGGIKQCGYLSWETFWSDRIFKKTKWETKKTYQKSLWWNQVPSCGLAPDQKCMMMNISQYPATYFRLKSGKNGALVYFPGPLRHLVSAILMWTAKLDGIYRIV